jgi:hypothetical protein
MPPIVYPIVLNASFYDSESCSVIGFSAGHLVNVGITESLDKKNSPRVELWCRYTWSRIRQIEACPTREWLAPQKPVVATERGTVRIGVLTVGVRPEVERNVDSHAPLPAHRSVVGVWSSSITRNNTSAAGSLARCVGASRRPSTSWPRTFPRFVTRPTELSTACACSRGSLSRLVAYRRFHPSRSSPHRAMAASSSSPNSSQLASGSARVHIRGSCS